MTDITRVLTKAVSQFPRQPLRLVAVDPGDVWCGIARLDMRPLFNRTSEVSGVECVLDARVLHLPERSCLQRVHEVIFCTPAPHGWMNVVVAENFKIRPQAFNSFSAGDTLRLLGALEYAVSTTKRTTWAEPVAPADPDKYLPLLSNGALDSWLADGWPQPKHAQWVHARSAWRVALYWLATNAGLRAQWLRHGKHFTTVKMARPTFPLVHAHAHDLLAREWTIRWVRPGVGAVVDEAPDSDE